MGDFPSPVLINIEGQVVLMERYTSGIFNYFSSYIGLVKRPKQRLATGLGFGVFSGGCKQKERLSSRMVFLVMD